MKRNREFRWAEIMRHLQGNPRTIKEIAKYTKVHYDTARKYLVELLLEGKIEVHEVYTKPIRYRKKK
jgi:predicted ArsR family transcriptional regulator